MRCWNKQASIEVSLYLKNIKILSSDHRIMNPSMHVKQSGLIQAEKPNIFKDTFNKRYFFSIGHFNAVYFLKIFFKAIKSKAELCIRMT
jgi:hypothetical protein